MVAARWFALVRPEASQMSLAPYPRLYAAMA